MTEFQILITQFRQFKDQLEHIDYVHQKEEFLKIMKQFRDYIVSVDDVYLSEAYFHSKESDTYTEFFREKNYYYLRALESTESLNIISKGNYMPHEFSDLLHQWHIVENYKKKEYDFKWIKNWKDKTVVCVWSGSMPETMLYLYENTDAVKIIWLDNNYEAVFISGELIRNLWLTTVEILYADGRTYDYKDADIVYIPAFPFPKNEIVSRIIATSKDSVEILVDQSKMLRKMLYDDISIELHPRLKIEAIFNVDTVNAKRDILKLVKYNIA